ncbi:MAG TPA: peptidoglycan DD-metalloendopeptidase family protein [Candidatus Polarisedimenticolia bacterium]|nr:peptidoglycan DD-metalloendopeptidase family protein [Candidatus Polarisedimenticolia bacterium]
MKRRAPGGRFAFPLLIPCYAAVLFVCACGGRAASRMEAEPAQPVDASGRPLDPGRPVGSSGAARPEKADKPSPTAQAIGAAPSIAVEDLADETDDGDDAASPAGEPPRPAGPTASGVTPPPGVYHPLEHGQTLYSLARAYQVPLATLMRVNGITDPTTIRSGTAIFIPLAPRDHPAPAPGPHPPGLPGPAPPMLSPGAPGGAEPPGSGQAMPPPAAPSLSWPLQGRITAPFGRRGRRSHHDGVDIDGVKGEEVMAAAGGTVIRAGRGQRYGRLVVIDHGGGVTTLYAHASRLLVHVGDQVARGEPIAEVGRSGNARGTHLHFEVRRAGRPIDPLPLLRSVDLTTAAAGPR